MPAVGRPPLLGWNCNWGIKRGQANLLASSEHRWCGIVESLQRSALWSWSDELLSVWAEARLPCWELLHQAHIPEAPHVCWHTQRQTHMVKTSCQYAPLLSSLGWRCFVMTTIRLDFDDLSVHFWITHRNQLIMAPRAIFKRYGKVEIIVLLTITRIKLA